MESCQTVPAPVLLKCWLQHLNWSIRSDNAHIRPPVLNVRRIPALHILWSRALYPLEILHASFRCTSLVQWLAQTILLDAKRWIHQKRRPYFVTMLHPLQRLCT